MDFCPNARILLVGCKTDLRTDVCTLMELSMQKMAPVSHEQVIYSHLLDYYPLTIAWYVVLYSFGMALLLGVLTRKAGGSRGISGMLRIYVREKHSQRFSFSGAGLPSATC